MPPIWYLNGDKEKIDWFSSNVVALSFTSVIMITFVIVREKYNPTKMLNRLSLVPHYAILLYIFSGVIKESLIVCKFHF